MTIQTPRFVPLAVRPTTPSSPPTLTLRRAFAGLLLAGLLLCGANGVARAQPPHGDANGVCRVTTDGLNGNNGESWAHPADLQSAVGSYFCEEVWVKEGTYFADVSPYHFTIRFDKKVYGGFAGNETSSTQRDPAAHLTILSGDADHDDANFGTTNIDETPADIDGANGDHGNSHKVVLVQADVNFPVTDNMVIDGFTITGGDGRAVANGFGGGLICQGPGTNNQCNPILSHLIFVGNIAPNGGALYLNGSNSGNSSPQISDVLFIHNEAANSSNPAHGGALYCGAQNNGRCNPTLTRVTFSFNDAGSFSGGAMYNDAASGGVSSPTLTDVTFDHNFVGGLGGAMFNNGVGGTSNPVLTNVTFNSNSAHSGGAIYNDGKKLGTPGDASPTLRNVTFSGNHASFQGGAVLNFGGSDGHSVPTFTNVTFIGNTAGSGGGAIYGSGNGSGTSGATLTNVILWGNTAGDGAAIYIDNRNFGTDVLTINHSIVQGGDSEIYVLTGNNASSTRMSSTAFVDGTLNFNGDPVLSSLGSHGGFTQTRLPGFSGMAVDNGTCNGAPATDQRGVQRPQGSGCDIGSVEAQRDLIFADGFE